MDSIQWLKGWDKDTPSHVALCLQKMWLRHGTNVFPSGELRYHSEKKRYVSARGLCNGQVPFRYTSTLLMFTVEFGPSLPLVFGPKLRKRLVCLLSHSSAYSQCA